MMFMIVWWIVIIIIIALFIGLRTSRNAKTKKTFNEIIGFLALSQLFIILIAIFTKDPLFEAIGLPNGYEWIGGLFASLFVLWISYLSPLKNRVIDVEKKVERIDERTGKIPEMSENISWIKNNCKVCKK